MRIAIAAFLLMAGGFTFAKETVTPRAFKKEFVQVRESQRLWVEHRPAVDGKPTVVFLNGLTWSTKQWQPLVSALDKLDPEIGIVLYDMQGMGETLLDKKPVTWEIPFDAQIRDLKDLYRKLGLRGPKVLAGLSYGGAAVLEYLSRYPNDFDKGVAIAPFLERLPDQDKWIRGMIQATRQTFPMNPLTDEELYDYYLRILVYSTYPSAEPIMLENPYKTEAVFRMVKGAKEWRAMDIATHLPQGKLHLLAGQKDPFVQLPWLQNFWLATTAASRASFIVFRGSGHKLPQEKPEFTAAWLMQILAGNPALNQGLTFDGDPETMSARSGDVFIPMSKVGSCERPFLSIVPPVQ